VSARQPWGPRRRQLEAREAQRTLRRLDRSSASVADLARSLTDEAVDEVLAKVKGATTTLERDAVEAVARALLARLRRSRDFVASLRRAGAGFRAQVRPCLDGIVVRLVVRTERGVEEVLRVARREARLLGRPRKRSMR
jgi:hypothetical protein